MSRLITKYKAMFQDLLDHNHVTDNLVERAIQVASNMTGGSAREDRMVWILRHLKHEVISSVESPLSKKSKVFLKRFKIDKEHYFFSQSLSCQLNRNALSHFTSQNLHWCNTIVFKHQSFNELIDELKTAESKYHQKLKQTTLFLKPEGTLICHVDENFAWYDLNKSRSYEEGLSMRHCGNSYFVSGDTILSLREKLIVKGREVHQPHLTFVLNLNTRKLGERKGRFNLTPNPKYHEAIVWLLLEDVRIKGFSDSNHHALEHDFQLSQLSNEHYQIVSEQRPDLVNRYINATQPNYLAMCAAFLSVAKRQGDAFAVWMIKKISVNGLGLAQSTYDINNDNCRKSFITMLEADKGILKDFPFELMKETSTPFSELFIKAFVQNPKTAAITVFLNLYKACVNKKEDENDLNYLIEFYPEQLTNI